MNFLPVPHEVMNWKNNGLVHAFIIFSNKNNRFKDHCAHLTYVWLIRSFFVMRTITRLFWITLTPSEVSNFTSKNFRWTHHPLLLFLLAFNVSQDSRIIITEKYKVWKWLFSKPKNNRKTIILHVTTQACQIGHCRRMQNLTAQNSCFYSPLLFISVRPIPINRRKNDRLIGRL